MAKSSKCTRDQVSSDSESSRENVDDSDMDTASGHGILCSDTDEVSIQTAHKKYQKRVWASCGLSKGSLWMEVQLKRISDSCQDMSRHDHNSVTAELIVLLWKTTTPLKCKKWWSGLTNCSVLLRPLAPKFTLVSQRPKPMAG